MALLEVHMIDRNKQHANKKLLSNAHMADFFQDRTQRRTLKIVLTKCVKGLRGPPTSLNGVRMQHAIIKRINRRGIIDWSIRIPVPFI